MTDQFQFIEIKKKSGAQAPLNSFTSLGVSLEYTYTCCCSICLSQGLQVIRFTIGISISLLSEKYTESLRMKKPLPRQAKALPGGALLSSVFGPVIKRGRRFLQWLMCEYQDTADHSFNNVSILGVYTAVPVNVA